MPFVAYIDESGEAGISRVREGNKPGASPYFVIGAAVLQPAAIINAKSLLVSIRERIAKQKWKHATDLDHATKVFFAREVSRLNVRFFAVISNKATLQDYREQIDEDPQMYYNKCLKYLLERICSYLARFGVSSDDISFILERRNHDYDRMLRYLIKVKENPIYPESKALSALNPFAIGVRGKDEEELLQLADFVAHAVYQCANKTVSNYGIPESRYFEELSSRFASDEAGLIAGTGLKFIHNIKMLKLDDDIERVFLSARAKLPSGRRTP